MTATEGLEDVRRSLLARFRLPSRAWSMDGRRFSFRSSLEEAPAAGSYVRVTTDDGRRFVGQVHERAQSVHDLGDFELDAAELTAGLPGDAAGLRRASLRVPVRVVDGGGVLLRQEGDVTAGSPLGFADARVAPASGAEVSALVDGLGGAVLEIGRLTTASVPAVLRATGFGRHTFLCGQSGSGKTYALGGVLERLLLDTELRIIVLDPNSDHVHLGTLDDGIDVDETTRARFDEVAPRVRVARAGGEEGCVPLKIRFGDLTTNEQALTLRLDPVRDSEDYHAFADVVRRLGSMPYTLRDVRGACLEELTEAGQRLACRIDNLGVASWSIWAEPHEPSLAEADGDWRALVVDLGSLAEPDERSVVALAVLGRIRRRPDRHPVLVVLDEAHHVCPPAADRELLAAACEDVVWIAGEGRKYGIHLLVATQRPQKVHPNVVSQCDNLLLMRVNSREDVAEIARTFSQVPSALVAEATGFGLGEMLAGGPVAPAPLRLQVGRRLTPEGGGDVPTDWAHRSQ
jgi:uncharacterized protein